MHHCREATVFDIPFIADLSEAMHRESRYAKYPFRRDKIEALVNGLIHDPNGIVLITTHGMLYGIVDEFWFGDGRFANEFVLFVDADHRKTGEAVVLVREYIAAAKLRGAQEVMIEASTLVDTESTDRFFSRIGFTFCGGNFFMDLNA